jgi:hypothetical protein
MTAYQDAHNHLQHPALHSHLAGILATVRLKKGIADDLEGVRSLGTAEWDRDKAGIAGSR